MGGYINPIKPNPALRGQGRTSQRDVTDDPMAPAHVIPR
jgi:hypothetical protein